VSIAFLCAGVAATADRVEGGDLELRGFGVARGFWARGQETWLREGFGRLTEGASGPSGERSGARGGAQLRIEWTPTEEWLVRFHGVAKGEPSSYGGSRVGVTEAFVQYRPELTPASALRLRVGTFFPPTSLENVDALWQSPYTLTLSALNTWVGEEVRLTGLEGAALVKTGEGQRLELAGVLFGANDSAGTLLAWRGWSLGDRLTTIGELLPLPPLASLRPEGPFHAQRDGTRPVDELDGRPGWQVRGRWRKAGTLDFHVAYLDNRGDRGLHRGQYSWRTRFTTVGIELRAGPAWTLLAEAVRGDTGMGPQVAGSPHVDVGFRAGYALVSWGPARWRFSVRYDAFRNRDLDGTAEPGGESGSAWTVAAFWSPSEKLRFGAEYLDLRSDRPAAAYSGADPNTDARRGLVEVRLSF
jgi:hypothetical protein